ncbi:LPS export ABC transporter periplasmic protein LptC [Pseudodesulfovibrio senegalensis]|jgi:LPS export ABC transporter protein LptC|uniref:LPS export ABC transporter periplasmic protein LptC n=1 Tax=Pseudodesulfovibrio senegalensis TaxID=1721087 RepID=A0A6N6N797_9BACT|nr:LPS export ABC transporter periplasmic protein LptC [Pseudodesulfovibrio senegalensis]
MNLRPIFLWGAVFLCGLIFGYLVKEFVHTETKDMPATRTAPAERTERPVLEDADVEATDIELVQGKDGALQWKLQAREAKYDQDRKLVTVEMPQLTAFFGEDRQEVFIRADSGDIDQKNDNLTLWDNIDGRFGMFALKAQHFDYIGAIGKVFLKGGVSVHRPDLSVNATAVEIDIVTRELIAAGGVEATIIPQSLETGFEQEN